MVQMVSALFGFGYAVLASVLMRSVTDPSVALPSFVGLLAMSIASGALGLVNFILLLVGIVKFYTGKMEHGHIHSRNVDSGIIYFVIGYMLPLVGSFVLVGLVFSVLFSGGTVGTGTLLTMILILTSFSAVSAYCMAMMYRSMVGAFVKAADSTFRSATVLMVLNPLVSLGLVAALLPSSLPSSSANTTLSPALGLGGLIGLAAVYMFYKGYRSILEKMGSGEIKRGVPPDGAHEGVLAFKQMRPPQYPTRLQR